MPLRSILAALCFAVCAAPVLAAEPGRPATSHSRVTASAAGVRPAAASAMARVNVNRATLAQLVTLKGVGEKKARAILAWRREHGPFNSLEQFEEVPGIGPALIEHNRGRIVFR